MNFNRRRPLRDSRPWSVTQIYVEPIGLRECVLRVQYLAIGDVAGLAGRVQNPTLLMRVANWRLHDIQRWDELVRTMKVDVAPKPIAVPAKRERIVA